MPLVYIVMDYEDPDILGVFATEKLALAFIESVYNDIDPDLKQQLEDGEWYQEFHGPLDTVLYCLRITG